MNAPRLVSCYFGSGAAGQWPRLARVLELSARRHCPEWQVDVRAIVPTRLSVPTLTAA